MSSGGYLSGWCNSRNINISHSLLCFFPPTSQDTLTVKAPLIYLPFQNRFPARVLNFHCSLSVFSLFSSLEKKEVNCSRHWESRYQLNLLAQEGGFEITGKRWQEWQVLQTCLLLISHIRTWHSWCTSSKFRLWIFFRLLQDQLQRAIEMIASEK